MNAQKLRSELVEKFNSYKLSSVDEAEYNKRREQAVQLEISKLACESNQRPFRHPYSKII
jgi:hypothetical protein